MGYMRIGNEERVFQVDNECYIIYLGEHTDDDKPFIRIGNSSWLYQKIQDNLSTVIVPESYTGNPLQEIDQAKGFKGRYLGDPKVVGILKQFFDSFSVRDKQVTDYNEAETGEGRDLVYFYANGNVTLSFRKIKIFDLFKKEKSDRHYTQRCREQKQVFQKRPIRYDHDDFKGRGFFLTEEEFYLFEKGALFGLRMTRDYFETLCASGVDGDWLQGALVKLSVDSLNEDRGETFIQMLKRAKNIRKGIQVFTFDKEVNHRISQLFPDQESLPSILKLNHIEKDNSLHWKSYTLELQDGKYRFSLDGQHYLWAKGGKELLIGEEPTPVSSPLLKGIPYQLRKQELDPLEILEQYIHKLSYYLSISESNGKKKRLYQQSTQMMDAFLKGILDGKAQLTQVAEKVYQEYKKEIRRTDIDPYAFYFFSNCRSLLLMLNKKGDGNWKKKIQPILLSFESILSNCATPDPSIYPAQGYLWKELFFYIPVHRQKRIEERKKSLLLSEDIKELSKVNKDYYKKERLRLEALLQGLEEGTVIIQNDNKEDSPEKNKKTEIESTKMSGTGDNGDALPLEDEAKSAGKKSGKKKGWLWLLLILLGLLFLLPWSRILPLDRTDRSKDIIELAEGETLNNNLEQESDNSELNNEQTENKDGESSDPSEMNTTGDVLKDDNSVAEDSTELSNQVSDDNQDINPSQSHLEQTDQGEETINSENDNEENHESENITDSEEQMEAQLEQNGNSLVEKPFIMDRDFLDSFQVDGVFITQADIHLYANEIAVENGYRDLGFFEVDGEDPTFIYPGHRLMVPGEGQYRVMGDDNIWFIAAAFLEQQLTRDMSSFSTWKSEFDGASESRKVELKKMMNDSSDRSRCENFRILVTNWTESNR